MSPNRGFTLVETIIALALLASAAVALAQLIAVGVQTTTAARYRTLAAVMAQSKLEQLRGQANLPDIAEASEHLDGSGQPVCQTFAPCAEAVFTVTWSIAPYSAASGTVLIQIAARHAHRNYGEARAFAIAPRTIR